MTSDRILQIDAAATAASALGVLAARNTLSSWFGLSTPILLDGVAVGLLGYAGVMVAASRRQPVDGRTLMPFVIADWIWVAGSAVVLLLYWNRLAPAGRVLLIAAALAVDVVATLQFRAARPIGGAPPAGSRLRPGSSPRSAS